MNWHEGVKVGWAMAMLNAMKKFEARLHTIHWPFLVLHGEEDKLGELSGSQLLYEKAASNDKKIKVRVKQRIGTDCLEV